MSYNKDDTKSCIFRLSKMWLHVGYVIFSVFVWIVATHLTLSQEEREDDMSDLWLYFESQKIHNFVSSSLCDIRCIIHKVIWTCIYYYVYSYSANAIDFSFSVNFRHHQDVILVKSWPNLTFWQKYEERVTYRIFSVTTYAWVW